MEKQVQAPEAEPMQTNSSPCREEGECHMMIEQVWQNISTMSKVTAVSGSTDGKEIIEALPKGLGSGNEKEQLFCELCKVKCHSRRILQAHLGGKRHAARLKSPLVKVEMELAGGLPGLEMSPSNGRKRNRDELEGDAESQLSVGASNMEDHGSKERNQVQSSNINGIHIHSDHLLLPESLEGSQMAAKGVVSDGKRMRCQLCDIECEKASLEAHLAGRKHALRVKRMSSQNAPSCLNPTDSNPLGEREEREVVLESLCNNMVSNDQNGGSQNAPSCLNPTDTDPLGEREVKEVVQEGLCNIMASNDQNGGSVHEKFRTEENVQCILEGRSISKRHADYLKTFIAQGGISSCVIKGLSAVLDEFAGSEAGTTVLDIPPDSIDFQETDTDLCGTDCDINMDGSIINMHAACFLRFLTRFAFTKERDDSFQRKPSSNAPPVQPNSCEKREVPECGLCQVKCGSSKDLDIHLAGRKHAIQVKKLLGRCELCNVDCRTKKALEFHVTGKRHASKVRLMQKIRDFTRLYIMPSQVGQESNGNTENVLKERTESMQMEETKVVNERTESVQMEESKEDLVRENEIVTDALEHRS